MKWAAMWLAGRRLDIPGLKFTCRSIRQTLTRLEFPLQKTPTLFESFLQRLRPASNAQIN